MAFDESGISRNAMAGCRVEAVMQRVVDGGATESWQWGSSVGYASVMREGWALGRMVGRGVWGTTV